MIPTPFPARSRGWPARSRSPTGCPGRPRRSSCSRSARTGSQQYDGSVPTSPARPPQHLFFFFLQQHIHRRVAPSPNSPAPSSGPESSRRHFRGGEPWNGWNSMTRNQISAAARPSATSAKIRPLRPMSAGARRRRSPAGRAALPSRAGRRVCRRSSLACSRRRPSARLSVQAPAPLPPGRLAGWPASSQQVCGGARVLVRAPTRRSASRVVNRSSRARPGRGQLLPEASGDARVSSVWRESPPTATAASRPRPAAPRARARPCAGAPGRAGSVARGPVRPGTRARRWGPRRRTAARPAVIERKHAHDLNS